MIVYILLIVNLFISSECGLAFNGDRSTSNLPEWMTPKPAAVNSVKLLHNFCRKNVEGDEGNVIAEKALKGYKDCLSQYVQSGGIRKHMDEDDYIGVNEYNDRCMHSVELKQCALNYATSLAPCFGNDELAQTHAPNIANRTITKFCESSTKKLALLIADGVPDCIKSKREGIENCFNSTIGHLPTRIRHLWQITHFLINTTEPCRNVTNLQECLVNEFRTCNKPTTAQLVEFTFEHLPGRTPCSSPPKLNAYRSMKNGCSSNVIVSSVTLLLIVANIYFMILF